MKEKKSKKITVSLSYEENHILEELFEESNLTKSEIIRDVIDTAIEQSNSLHRYVNMRMQNNVDFNLVKDGFNSQRFAQTFINPVNEKLTVGLLLNMGNCRVLAEKGASAYIDKVLDKVFVIIKETKVRGEKKPEKCRIRFDLSDVKSAKIWNLESDISIDYHYIPAEEMAEHEFLEIIC